MVEDMVSHDRTARKRSILPGFPSPFARLSGLRSRGDQTHTSQHVDLASDRLFTPRLVALAVCSALLIPAAVTPQTEPIRFEDASPPFRSTQLLGLTQDRYGFLWIASPWRVVRYDGYSYSILYADTVLFTGRSQIAGLTGGKRGIICLFTHANELLFYDVNKNTKVIVSLKRAGGTKEYHIACVTEDDAGHFWIGCREGDLFRISPPDTGIVHVLGREGASSPAELPAIHAIAQDSLGGIWIGRTRGLLKLHDAARAEDPTSARCDSFRGLPSGQIVGLLTGRDGRLWMCTSERSVGWIDTGSGRFVALRPLPPEAADIDPTVMTEDRTGCIWISCAGDLYRWVAADRRWERHLVTTDSRGNPHPGAVVDAITDRSGTVWVISRARGLLHYIPKPKGFHSFVPGEGPGPRLSGSDVSAALVDRTGTLWVGRESGGLDYLKPGQSSFGRFVHDPRNEGSLSSNYVVCICERRNGELWIGNAGGDINIFDHASKTFRHPTLKPDWASPGSNTVTALYEDRRGTMWVGHYRGIDSVDPGSGRFSAVVRWPQETLGLVGSVTAIREDSGGNMWFGTRGRGLLRMRASRSDTTWYRHEEGNPRSLGSNSPQAFLQDREGRLWVGTGSGLGLFDYVTGRFQNHERWFPRGAPSIETGLTYGLARMACMGIVQDRHGDLWLSFDGVVARFDTKSGRFRFFGRRDGAVPVGARRGAFFITQQGTVYWGGTGGINWFDPDSLSSEAFIPPVVMTYFRVWQNAKFVPPGETTSFALDYTENNLTFEFAMLDFRNPDGNVCAYMLEGLDREWIPAVRERRPSYANVPPGRYMFRVRGWTSDGFSPECEASLSITISPPFWRTWWFGSLALTVFGSVLYALHRNRLARVRATERLRLRIADDLHDDIGSELSGIALEADLIARSLPPESPARPRLTNVGQTIRSAGENLRDVVWIVNPELDSVPDLIARMNSTAARMLLSHQYTFESPAGPSPVSLSLEFKRHVLMMFKEMLNNIVRHARATNVQIEVTHRNGHFRLCVLDNGTGFDSTAEVDGRGLASLRSRAEAIGGVLTIESTPGSGTRVCMEADITRSGD